MRKILSRVSNRPKMIYLRNFFNILDRTEISDRKAVLLTSTIFPCHTQNVERMVKIVTEVSFTACLEEARDGIIRAKLRSRKDIPRIETKKRLYSFSYEFLINFH